MHECIFVTWEMYRVGNFRSSLPSNKEDGGTPAGAPLDKPLYHAVAPRTGVRTASKLHLAGACYV